MYAHLNQYCGPESIGLSDAWRRVLGRLGEYTEAVVRSLNMRPIAATLLEQTQTHVLVRISLPNEYLVLRVAPDADVSSNLLFSRTMVAHNLPAAHVIAYDLSKTLVPFAYTLETYVCGVPGSKITSPHLLRVVARQSGRVLGRMHRAPMVGWGTPGPLKRWTTGDWHSVLQRLHTQLAPPPFDALVFSDTEQAAIAVLLDGPVLACARPKLVHGAFGPHAIRATVGDQHVQLEAFVEPGAHIGGDGLLDLAWGLLPCYPVAWCEGLLHGYSAAAPLNADDAARLAALRLLTCYWSACQRYMRAEPHEAVRNEVSRILQPIHGES